MSGYRTGTEHETGSERGTACAGIAHELELRETIGTGTVGTGPGGTGPGGTGPLGAVGACLFFLASLATSPPPATAEDDNTASPQQACFADCADGLSGQDDRGPMMGSPAPALDLQVERLGGGAQTAGSEIETETLGSLLNGRPLVIAFGSLT